MRRKCLMLGIVCLLPLQLASLASCRERASSVSSFANDEPDAAVVKGFQDHCANAGCHAHPGFSNWDGVKAEADAISTKLDWDNTPADEQMPPTDDVEVVAQAHVSGIQLCCIGHKNPEGGRTRKRWNTPPRRKSGACGRAPTRPRVPGGIPKAPWVQNRRLFVSDPKGEFLCRLRATVPFATNKGSL